MKISNFAEREEHPLFYKELRQVLFHLKFERLSEKLIKKHIKIYKIAPYDPKSDRIKDLETQASFVRYYREYQVVVHTSYNTEERAFPKAGKFWIVVSHVLRPTENVLIMQVRRNDVGFMRRATKLINAIAYMLSEGRPTDSETDSKFAEIYKDKERRSYWKITGKHKKVNFFINLPHNLLSVVQEKEYQRKYYLRHKQAGTNFEWQIRKKWRKIKKVVH